MIYAYPFITQNSSVFKFGVTKNKIPMDRLQLYYGLNKPSKILCVCLCDDKFESRFKEKIDQDELFERDLSIGLEWVRLKDSKNVDMAADYLKHLFYNTL